MRRAPEFLGNLLDGWNPRGYFALATFIPPEDLGQAILAVDPFVVQSSGVAHPGGIHAVVLARFVAIDLLLARAYNGVAARAATGAETLRLLEKPHPHLKPEILRGQRAHRADVHGVERVVVVELGSGEGRDGVIAAAVHDTELVISRDVLGEPDATRAENAALVVEHDARPKINGLRLVYLRLDKPAGRLAVLDRVLLQLALTRLVADRAIERMVDEQPFEDALSHLFGSRRTGINLHPRRDGRRTRNGTARRLRLVGQGLPGDFRRTILIQKRLAIRPHRRQAKLHQAHAAIARNRQLGMIAIVRHLLGRDLTGLQHRGRHQPALPVGHELGHLDLAAVHLDLDLLDRRRRGGRGGLGFGCYGGGHA